jgi:probable HAF family extracellular repeat protein
MHRWTLRAAFSAALMLASLTAMAAKPAYQIEPLPVSEDGITPVYPVAINNQGVVFGRARDKANHQGRLLFLYADGTTSIVQDTVKRTEPVDLNDAGDMLIDVEDHSAVFWHDGRREEFDGPFFAKAINGLGELAGVSANHAAIWKSGVMTDLGTLGGEYSYATAISDTGYVGGQSAANLGHDDHVRVHAFIWFNGEMKDLGTFGGGDSQLTDVNNLGHAIGVTQDEIGNPTPYFYDGVKKHHLPGVALPSTPADINNLDEIVGSNADGALLTTGGRSYFLIDLLKGGHRWDKLITAASINDAGDIVGWGFLNGKPKVYRATRIQP